MNTHNKKHYKLAYLPLVTFIGLALTACQTTPGSGQNSFSAKVSQLPADQQSQLAKETLLQAIQKQYRSDYAYHVNVLASNDQRRDRLANATAQQLAMSDNPIDHCDHIHDEAYVELLQKAEQAGLEITDPKYSSERQTIKQSFQQCTAALEETYSEESFDYWFSKAVKQAKQDINEAAEESSEEEIIHSEYTDEDSITESDYEDEYEGFDNLESIDSNVLPDYDSSHTKLDARKAELLNAYLLKPMSITSTGVYRASTAQFSMVPTFAYQSRNLTVSNSHFIYADAKEGAVYLWADTFAYLLSSYFDPKLGISMQNKWIKIDLNDGSLPKSFLPDLVKSHLHASKKMYDNSTNEQYQFISADQLNQQLPKPDAKHQPYLTQTPLIIERRQSEEQYDEAMQVYLTTLYDQMTQKYPELIASDNGIESDEVSGELEETEAEEEVLEAEDSELVTSRDLFVRIFEAIGKSKEQTASKMLSNNSETIQELGQDNSKDKNDAKSKIDYAIRDKDLSEQKWLWRNVYGIDNQQRIVWQLAQRQIPNLDTLPYRSSELLTGLRLEALTRYSSIPASQPMFDILPVGAALPSKSNSIDLKNYIQKLKSDYERGEGTEQGKILFESINRF